MTTDNPFANNQCEDCGSISDGRPLCVDCQPTQVWLVPPDLIAKSKRDAEVE